MHLRYRAVLALVTTALLAAGLSGCSLLGGEPSPSAPSATAKAANTVGKGEAKAVDPGKTLATSTFDSPLGKVDVAVLSLAARGKLAHLAMSVTPHSTGNTPNLYRLNGGSRPSVSLLDPVNLKRYVVVKDSGGGELWPDMHASLNNDQANSLSYTFAAPPENVKAVDVQFQEFPIFRNVPIER